MSGQGGESPLSLPGQHTLSMIFPQAGISMHILKNILNYISKERLFEREFAV